MILGDAKNMSLLLCVFAVAISIYFSLQAHPMQAIFPIKHIAFTGSGHLTEGELKALAGIHTGESLMMLSSGEISRQLLRSPWIKSVNVRKEFPDRVSIVIREAEPFALLEMREHLFLIDEGGEILEELNGDSVPFLPVITGDPFKEKEVFTEALNLVRRMHEKGFPSERDHIDIQAHTPNELSVEIDGTLVKMGTGAYEEKLERFIQLEEEIRNRGIPVDHIDLRFSNRAVVKPVTGKAMK